MLLSWIIKKVNLKMTKRTNGEKITKTDTMHIKEGTYPNTKTKLKSTLANGAKIMLTNWLQILRGGGKRTRTKSTRG